MERLPFLLGLLVGLGILDASLTCRFDRLPGCSKAVLLGKGYGVFVHLKLRQLTLNIRGADPILRPRFFSKNLIEDLGKCAKLDLKIGHHPPTKVKLIGFEEGILNESLSILLGQLAPRGVILPFLDDVHKLGVKDVIKVF